MWTEGFRGGRAAVLCLAGLLAAAPGCGGSSSDGWLEDEDEFGEDEVYRDEPDFIDAVAWGTVIAIDAALDDDGDHAHRRRSRERTARADLVRDPASGDGDDRGHVRIRASRRRESLRVRMEGLAPGRRVDVYLSDGAGSDALLGHARVGTGGRALFLARSDDPLRVAFTALAGLVLEVRDEAGVPLLRGRVPSPWSPAGSRWARGRTADPGTGAGVVATLAVSGREGRRRARLDLTGLPPGTEVEVLVGDPPGPPCPCGTAPVDEGGTARLLFDSRRGDPLPAGAEHPADLSGRPFLVAVGGEVLLEGAFPVL